MDAISAGEQDPQMSQIIRHGGRIMRGLWILEMNFCIKNDDSRFIIYQSVSPRQVVLPWTVMSPWASLGLEALGINLQVC